MLLAWGAGAFVCLLPVLLTPWRLRQLRRHSRRWGHGETLARTLEPAATSHVGVFIHDEATAPLTCGIARPAILLPATAARWSDVDIQRALVHELEHVRRSDWPVYVATRIVCALYWFHPLVWIAWRRLGLEAERACDDAVLRVSERTAYAQQLVTLARQHARPSAIPVLSMAGRSDLSARVAAVLDDTQVRGRLGLARTGAIVVGAMMLVAGVAPLRAAQVGQLSEGPEAEAPAFDVVSVRANKSGELGQTMRRQPGGRVIAINFRLRELILSAYGLQPQQLAGGPDWIDSDRFDITAQARGEIPMTPPGTVGPLQLMMQRLLADRFNLVVHTETREMPIYALTLARSDGRLGSQITTAVTDCQTVMTALLKNPQSAGGAPPQPPRLPNGGPACGMMFDGSRLRAGGASMAQLAGNLSQGVGRTTVDRTGLTGGFDFELEFSVDPALAAGGPAFAPSPDPNKPSIFTALEEQLGLKLQPDRAPVEVLVIDRVEQPTEN